jgi:hypothetical protein
VGQRRASTHQTKRKLLIIREWRRWLLSHSIDRGAATARDTLSFFYELQDKRPTLLKFQSRGRDKWEIINSWLLACDPWGRKMLAVLDPEEIVVLANHGAMKLRSAVARAMALLPEDRDAAIIVRKELSQSILGFEQIKQLAERWEQADAGCSLR